jgi:NADH-quinone oxidoreductase subunit D
MDSRLVSWNLGPYNSILLEPLLLKMQLLADRVVSCEVESGFLYRDLEGIVEKKKWGSILSCLDHLDPENAIHCELAFCLAVEELADISVPARAQDVRIILSEASRMCSHLLFVARLAKSVGAYTAMSYLLRDRERLLDVFELLTGMRFSFNFLKIGGVKLDLTEGFIERILDACDLIASRLKEYNDLFTYNVVFYQRAVGAAKLSYQTALACGATGPNALASGLDLDIRKRSGYSGYNQVEFSSVPVHFQNSDVHSRCLIRLHQIYESMKIIHQVAHRLAPGSLFHDTNTAVAEMVFPDGEAYSRVETSRGLLCCHVVSCDKKLTPSTVSFRAPSQFHLQLLPEVLTGLSVDDIGVALASFDLCVAEADK